MKILLIAASLLSFANLNASDVEQRPAQQHQMRNVQLNIENKAPALDGCVLEIEIRKVNDPIFSQKFDLNLAASASLSRMLNIDFQDMQDVAASNLIVRLVKLGEGGYDVDNRYITAFKLDSFAGFKVMISPKDVGNLALGNKVEIYPTVDAAGHNPVE